MDKNSKILIEKFKEIANKRWIPSIDKSWGSIGNTFEHELGKNPDDSYNPDYLGIELKCSSRFSRYPLHLFSLSFDGPEENEIYRLTEKYGTYDKDYKDKKTLYKTVNSYKAKQKYHFKLNIDYKQEKIYLCVLNDEGILLEQKSYVLFSSVKRHLYTKLKKLAFIRASIKKENEEKYFRYYHLSLYKLRNFKIFLKLLEEGTIKMEIITSVRKSGISEGRYRAKSVCFYINKKDIDKLFSRYFKIEY